MKPAIEYIPEPMRHIDYGDAYLQKQTAISAIEQAQKDAWNAALEDVKELIPDTILQYYDSQDYSAGIDCVPNPVIDEIEELKL